MRTGGISRRNQQKKDIRPPEIINTPRLQLRRAKMDDAKEIFANYAQDTEVTYSPKGLSGLSSKLSLLVCGT